MKKFINTIQWKLTFLGLWWNRQMSRLSFMPETPSFWSESASEAYVQYRSEKLSGYTW